MAIIGTPINTNKFTWHPEFGVFTQEASSLKGVPIGALYDDAADVGFVLVSERTGKELPYYLDKEVVIDGEVTEWIFVPVTDDPVLKNIFVHIVND